MVNRSRNKGFNRSENTRDIKKTVSESTLMTISFKDIDFTQPPNNVQSFATWQNAGLLESLCEKIKELTKLSRNEAVKQQIIKAYGAFPSHSRFTHPPHVDENVNWCVLKNIGHQKRTLAGYIVENTFYAVFLDKDHEFWPTTKKNT